MMNRAQLSAQPKPRRKPTDVGLRPEHSIAPNMLERDFASPSPNRKWAAGSRTPSPRSRRKRKRMPILKRGALRGHGCDLGA